MNSLVKHPTETNYFEKHAPGMVDMGFIVLPIIPLKKKVAISGWRDFNNDKKWLAENLKKYAKCNTGTPTGNGLLAVDCDLDDPEAAGALLDFCRQEYDEDLIIREKGENTGRFLLLFRCEDIRRKAKISYKCPDDSTRDIEIMSDGQYVVTHGVVAFNKHDKLISPLQYWWHNDKSPTNTPFVKLPHTTFEKLKDVLKRFEEDISLEGWRLFKSDFNRATEPSSAGNSNGDDDMLGMVSRSTRVDMDQMRRRAEYVLINRKHRDGDRGTWYRIIFSIKACYPPNVTAPPDWLIEANASEEYPDHEKKLLEVWKSDDPSKGGRDATGYGSLKDLSDELGFAEYEERYQQTVAFERYEIYKRKIRNCNDEKELRTEVMPSIKYDTALKDLDRETLASDIHQHWESQYVANVLGWLKPPAEGTIRKEITPPKIKKSADNTSKNITMAIINKNKDKLLVDKDGSVYVDGVRPLSVDGASFANECMQFAFKRGDVLTPQQITNIASTLGSFESRARECVIAKRYAQSMDGKKIYVDMCDDNNTVLEISRTGVRPIAHADMGDIRFVRVENAASLPPYQPMTLERVVEILGPGAPVWDITTIPADDLPVCLAWLLQGMRVAADQLLLCFHGPSGTAKTHSMGCLQKVFDPKTTNGLTKKPANERDMAAILAGSCVVMLDNVSGGFSSTQEDMLCIAATGGSDSRATLHKNSGMTVRDLKGPVGITALHRPFKQADLNARTLHVPFKPISSGYNDKKNFEDEFDAQASLFFSALAHLQAEAMRLESEGGLKILGRHRMQGFCRVGQAVQQILGYHPGTIFEGRLLAESKQQQADSLEEFPALMELIQQAIRYFAEASGGEWEVAPSQLFSVITLATSRSIGSNSPNFPTTPAALRKQMSSNQSALHEWGLDFREGKRKNNKRMLIITLNEQAADRADPDPRLGYHDGLSGLEDADSEGASDSVRIH